MPEITYNEHMMYGIVAIAWVLTFANVIRTKSDDYSGGNLKLFAKAALWGTLVAILVRGLLHVWFE